MPEDHVIYGFTAGELSPELYGRKDLTKYALGVGYAKNFQVDVKGALENRAGSEFVGQLELDSEHKLIRFKAEGDDFQLLFSDLKMRVVRNGGFILETEVAITNATATDPVVVTAASHGYSNGDWVFIYDVEGMTELNGRYFTVANVTTNTFELTDPDGRVWDGSGYTAYASGGKVARVYTLTTPYVSADLRELRGEQVFDKMRLTHLNYARQLLTYNSDTDWTIEAIEAGSDLPFPTGVSATASAAGSAGAIYVVTAVDADGNESLPSAYHFLTSAVDITETAGSVTVKWDPQAGAKYYHVYRSSYMADDAKLSYAMETGYLGRALGPQFIDNNIIPDFTALPPVGVDPFSNDSIFEIEITAQGTGYSNTSTVTIGGPGSGFVGYPVVSDSGAIIGVNIVNGGSGYTAPVVSFSDGTGATAVAKTTPSSGNNPRTAKRFQQRMVYAGTYNTPMTVDGSKPGTLENFDKSTISKADDAYSFTLDSSSVTPIKHLVALRTGLLVFTNESIVMLRAEEGKALSALNAIAETQAERGASDVPPILLDLDILFSEESYGKMYSMVYTQYTNSYDLEDMSILAEHLFTKDNKIVSMTYSDEPLKIVYCIREDGTRLLFTYERKQEVYGWTRDETRGKYKDNLAIHENGGTVVYQVVERNLVSGTKKFLERIVPREFTQADDSWFVDCGLRNQLARPAVTCTPAAIEGLGVTVNFGGDISSDIAAGDFLYVGGGKMEVLTVDSATEVTVNFHRAMTAYQREDAAKTPDTIAAGEWEVGTPQMEIKGAWHLEGETVSYVVDGDGHIEETIVNGGLSFALPATRLLVGLGYTGQIRTLSMLSNAANVDGRLKKIYGLGLRQYQSLGMEIGSSFEPEDMFTQKERTNENWGEPLRLKSGYEYNVVETTYDADGYVYLQQRYPLPAAVLGYVLDADVGGF